MLEKNQNKKRKPHNKYLALTSLSIQMGATIYLGSYIGGVLDKQNHSENSHYTAVFVLISVVIAMYMFIKQAKKLNND